MTSANAWDRLPNDDVGLHEGSGYAAGDAEEICWAGEDLYERSLRVVGEVDLHAVAHAACDLFVHCDGWEFRQ